MRITIFGATGLLGKALVQEWKDDEITGLSSKDADLRNAGQVAQAIKLSRPDWIVLAAAYTDVDGCEKNSQLAFEVNFRGAVNVAKAAKEFSSRLLFLSTDYVFDGAKTTPYETTDHMAPLSVYGRSKAQAEAALAELLPECCIVRTSWLFGRGGRCFPDTILKLAAEREEISVVDDQRGSPTYAPDLAQAIVQLCRKRANGIVHATNRGDCTWFQFARHLLANAGLATVIRPIRSDAMIRPAKRPSYSVLSPTSLERFGIMLPTWQNGVERYLKEIRSGQQISVPDATA